MDESGMRIVVSPAAARESAVARPENLRVVHCQSCRVEKTGRETNEGAVSATITVNCRLRAAAFKNASTVRLCPIVKMNSLHTCNNSISDCQYGA